MCTWEVTVTSAWLYSWNYGYLVIILGEQKLKYQIELDWINLSNTNLQTQNQTLLQPSYSPIGRVVLFVNWSLTNLLIIGSKKVCPTRKTICKGKICNHLSIQDQINNLITEAQHVTLRKPATARLW